MLPLKGNLAEAAEELRDQVLTAPSDEGLLDATLKIFKGRKPDHIYLYRDVSGGGILQGIARWNNVNGKKEIRSFCYTEEGWQCRAHPAPRPLFNLDQISADGQVDILIVEGEKAAEAAAAFFPGVVSTWAGGAKAVDKTDFSTLSGRKVWVWPDNDPSGQKAMHQVAQKLQNLGANVRLVDLEALATHRPVGPTLTEGWDAADAVEEGWDKAGEDPHRMTAALLLQKPPELVTKEERQLAKAVNFGLLFGQGPKGLSEYADKTYGVKMSLEEAVAYRRAWPASDKAYPDASLPGTFCPAN